MSVCANQRQEPGTDEHEGPSDPELWPIPPTLCDADANCDGCRYDGVRKSKCVNSRAQRAKRPCMLGNRLGDNLYNLS